MSKPGVPFVDEAACETGAGVSQIRRFALTGGLIPFGLVWGLGQLLINPVPVPVLGAEHGQLGPNMAGHVLVLIVLGALCLTIRQSGPLRLYLSGRDLVSRVDFDPMALSGATGAKIFGGDCFGRPCQKVALATLGAMGETAQTADRAAVRFLRGAKARCQAIGGQGAGRAAAYATYEQERQNSGKI